MAPLIYSFEASDVTVCEISQENKGFIMQRKQEEDGLKSGAGLVAQVFEKF